MTSEALCQTGLLDAAAHAGLEAGIVRATDAPLET
jgi:hypothetical protein